MATMEDVEVELYFFHDIDELIHGNLLHSYQKWMTMAHVLLIYL